MEYALNGANSLTTVIFEEGLTIIPAFALATMPDQKSALRRITIPPSVTHIKESAFRNSESLESMPTMANVVSIGESSFRGCTSIKEVRLPSSVKRVNAKSFSGCTQLSSIVE